MICDGDLPPDNVYLPPIPVTGIPDDIIRDPDMIDVGPSPGSGGDGVFGLGEVVAFHDAKAAESATAQAELNRLAEEAHRLAPDTLVLDPIIVTGMAEDEPKFGGWLDEMVIGLGGTGNYWYLANTYYYYGPWGGEGGSGGFGNLLPLPGPAGTPDSPQPWLAPYDVGVIAVSAVLDAQSSLVKVLSEQLPSPAAAGAAMKYLGWGFAGALAAADALRDVKESGDILRELTGAGAALGVGLTVGVPASWAGASLVGLALASAGFAAPAWVVVGAGIVTVGIIGALDAHFGVSQWVEDQAEAGYDWLAGVMDNAYETIMNPASYADPAVLQRYETQGKAAAALYQFGHTAGVPTPGLPVVIDLDRDGLDAIALKDSTARFDWNGDGKAERTAWVKGDDGILVRDVGNDGKVTRPEEISFIRAREGATSDLDGLKAFDTNQNGKLDAGDKDFVSFKIWQDKDSDGQVDAGEMKPLGEHGITSVDLIGAEEPKPAIDGAGILIEQRSTAAAGSAPSLPVLDVTLFYDSAPVDGAKIGGANADPLAGAAGADYLAGRGGDDTLTGNGGNDFLLGETGADSLDGGAGDDVLYGGGEADTLIGGDGEDTASYRSARGGVNVNLGTGLGAAVEASGDKLSGVENVVGGFGDDWLRGDAGRNLFVGNEGKDTIAGYGGDDILLGGEGDDVLDGGEGDDQLHGGVGADRLMGGAGRDTAFYADAVGAVNVNLTTGIGAGATSDTLSGVENLIGSRFDDWLRGDGAANMLAGNGGIDTIAGFGGNDALLGDDGNDVLSGGDGDDILLGGAGADKLEGGSGTDTASYFDAVGAVNVNLATGIGAGATGDTLSGIENLIGSKFSDWLRGDGAANILVGGGGTDTIAGFGGNDVLVGGQGADNLSGGDGFDIASYTESGLAVNVSLTDGKGYTADANGDTLSGIEALVGSAYDDWLRGDAAANMLFGGAGKDTLVGFGGDDMLVGGAGADVLTGGDGVDTASYRDSAAAVTASLRSSTFQGGDAQGDSLIGIENLEGSEYGDTLYGDAGANVLIGQAGQDILGGYIGDDILIGGRNVDTLSGDDGDDVLWGGEGADRLSGSAGRDVALYGDAAKAVRVELEAGKGGEIGTFDRQYYLARYTDVANAGVDPWQHYHAQGWKEGRNPNATFDTKYYLAQNPDVAAAGIDPFEHYLGNGWKEGRAPAPGYVSQVDSLSGVEDVIGSNFNDVLAGNSQVNQLLGGQGDDMLGGKGGDDRLAGDTGADSLWGDDGNDILWGQDGADALYGDAGDDVLVGGRGGADADRLDGGAGWDFADYTGSFDAVYVDLWQGKGFWSEAAGDTLTGIEEVWGSRFNDTIVGGAIGETLRGLQGNDTLQGGGGADTLIGGDGWDIALYTEDGGGVSVDLASGRGLRGTAEGDRLGWIEEVRGGRGGDVLLGDGARNVLLGGDGDDYIAGRGGSDHLDGGVGWDWLSYRGAGSAVNVDMSQGKAWWGEAEGDTLAWFEGLEGSNHNDTLTGDGGDNRLIGGLGADTLRGGNGRDVFVYNSTTESTPGAADRIEGFVQGQDKIDLSAIDADVRPASWAAGNNAFLIYSDPATFGVMMQPFVIYENQGEFQNAYQNGGSARHVYATREGADLHVHVEINGDEQPDLTIVLVGQRDLKLTMWDFVL